MYLLGRNNNNNNNNDNIVIDIGEEKHLVDEEEEIIMYDDLNINQDNTIKEVIIKMDKSSCENESSEVPRPTLVIPKSPKSINSDSSDEEEIFISEIGQNNSDIVSVKTINTDISPVISPVILDNNKPKQVFFEKKCIVYSVNMTLCGVLVYIFLIISGVIS